MNVHFALPLHLLITDVKRSIPVSLTLSLITLQTSISGMITYQQFSLIKSFDILETIDRLIILHQTSKLWNCNIKKSSLTNKRYEKLINRKDFVL